MGQIVENVKSSAPSKTFVHSIAKEYAKLHNVFERQSNIFRPLLLVLRR